MPICSLVKTERVQIQMGGEVGRICEVLGEGGPIIRIYCIENPFSIMEKVEWKKKEYFISIDKIVHIKKEKKRYTANISE